MADVEKSNQYEEAQVSHGEFKPTTFQAEGMGEINSETVRGLNSRHIQFLALGMFPFYSNSSFCLVYKLTTNWIAIGGCIGTGLFVGAGAVLADVGPGEKTS